MVQSGGRLKWNVSGKARAHEANDVARTRKFIRRDAAGANFGMLSIDCERRYQLGEIRTQTDFKKSRDSLRQRVNRILNFRYGVCLYFERINDKTAGVSFVEC